MKTMKSRRPLLIASVLAILCSVLFLGYHQWTSRLYAAWVSNAVSNFSRSDSPSLASAIDYLEDRWRVSPESFLDGVERLSSESEKRAVPFPVKSLLDSFSHSHENFCGEFVSKKVSEPFGTYCENERIPLEKLPVVANDDWVEPDCTKYAYPKNREKCFSAVDRVFSKSFSRHCSNSACKNDQIAYRSLLWGGKDVSECQMRSVPLLVEGCETFVRSVIDFSKSKPVESFGLAKEVEDAISGKNADPVSEAVREAFFTETDSPWEKCAVLPSSDVARCESMVKAAFVQFEKEKDSVRMKRIVEAVVKTSK